MSGFDNKEKGEENKYAHDKEVQFLINARYHRLLASWAADRIGLTAEKAEEYKNAMVTSDLGKNDEQALFKKIQHDFVMNHIHINDHDLHEKMHNLLQDARQQVMQN